MYEEAILRLYTLLGHEIKADMWSPTIVATVGSQKELAKMPKQQQLLERLSMLGRYARLIHNDVLSFLFLFLFYYWAVLYCPVLSRPILFMQGRCGRLIHDGIVLSYVVLSYTALSYPVPSYHSILFTLPLPRSYPTPPRPLPLLGSG